MTIAAQQAAVTARGKHHRGQAQKLLWRQYALGKCVDGDPTAGLFVPVALKIGRRCKACINLAPVAAESDAREECLTGIEQRARLGKISDGSRTGVEDCERLHVSGFES